MNNGMVFDEQQLLKSNIFKYEDKLKNRLNRYLENGMLLTTYFAQEENAITVDRGTRDIEQLFGNKSPLRFNKIENLPMNGFNQINPDNTEEMEVEDFNVEGEAIIMTGIIVPKVLDFFIINHLKMNAIFEVKSVTYDSMKIDGHYKIGYRLYSTSAEIIERLNKQTIDNLYTDLSLIGTAVNPVMRKDDYLYRIEVQKMAHQIIESYKALFYNERHNCFLYFDPKTTCEYFDMCGNEFMAKHGLMNYENCNSVVVLGSKIRDPQFPLLYNNSIYQWFELGAESRSLQTFQYMHVLSECYPLSSFSMWDEDVMIIIPLSLQQKGHAHGVYFNNDRFNTFLDSKIEPQSNEYDKLIWKFINKKDTLNIHDVSLFTGDALLASINHLDIYLFTPIILYIIKKILNSN